MPTACTFQHPAAAELTVTRVLHALSDPTRLAIVRDLTAAGERACGDFNHLVAKSTLTHHFRVLRDAGLIRGRPDGPCVRLSVRRKDLDDRFPGLLDAVLNAAPAGALA